MGRQRRWKCDDDGVTTEEPLAGGFGSLGAVVRIGDTIRRQPRRPVVDDASLADQRDALVAALT
jgi:hypothetical protein